MTEESSMHSQSQSLDGSAVIQRVDRLMADGEINSAWKLVAEYCIEHRRDAAMLARLRQVERFRMAGEPAGTRISFAYLVLNGMPFMEYSLRSIYDFAHEIIIVEGAVENCMFAANPDGSSTDGTVEFIKSFPDPDGKIRLIQGRWPEKMEMTNEGLRHVTGDYIWLMASDEVYRREDIEKILSLLRTDSSITQVDLIPFNFWKGFDYVVDCPRFLEPGLQFQGPIRFLKGARFVNHRPLQMKYPGYLLTADYMHRIDGAETRKAGIRLFHYSYVLDSQVYQKIELYRRYGWGKGWELDLEQWYSECFQKWTPENRRQIEREYPVWTGDRNSCTVPFTGEHPAVMREFIEGFRRGELVDTSPVRPDCGIVDAESPDVTVRSSQQILQRVAQFSRATSVDKLVRGDVAVRINSAEFRLQRIGTDYGGWVVPVNRVSKDSICYCVGAGEDISFDVGLVKKYGCDVHTFDPTPRAKAHIDLLRESTLRGLKVGIDGSQSEFYDVGSDQLDKIYFHPYGIWSQSCVQKFYAPSNPAHVSHSILNLQKTQDYFTARCLSLPDAMQRLGHDRIDLLKIDVEGAEYAIVDSIVASRIPIGILCLEFDELNVALDEKYNQRIHECITKLLDADYVPLFISGGARSDYTFVHASLCSEPQRPVVAERCGSDPVEEILRRPKYIKIETTNICNADCSFCAYGLMTRPKGVMAMDLFKGVVDQYTTMGGGQITISPEVGDCLVDAKLLERLRYCREFAEVTELGFHTNMIGLDRWTDDQVLEIIDLITWWACSVGPNRDVFRDMFGVDQFERVVANLERLGRLYGQSRNRPEVELNGRACGGAFNVDERLARLADELIGKPIKWMRVFGDWGGDLTTLPRDTQICRSENGSEKQFPCMKPVTSAVVFYDGKVGFCGCADYDAKLVIGDVNRESLKSILGGDKRREYLESFGTPHLNDYCKRCTFYEPLEEGLRSAWTQHQRLVSRRTQDVADKLTSSGSVFGLRDCVESYTTGISDVDGEKRVVAVASAEQTPDSQDAAVQRVLWIRTDSIGDNIMSASMLEHVHGKYPNAEIVVLCQEHIAELYDLCPYVHEVVSFNRVRALKDENYRTEIVERLRNVQADVALNSLFSREPLTDIFTIGSLAEQRIALDGDLCNMSREAKLMYNQHYTRLVPSAGEHKHEFDRHKDFLRGLGLEVGRLEPVIWTDSQDEEFAEDFFERSSLDPQRTIALFHSAQHFHKAYESYDNVVESLRDHGFNYVILGGNDQDAQEQADMLRSTLPAVFHDLTGQTTIRRMAAVIRKCRLYLGSDSAGAHVACAVGTPNVVILGGGHFGRFIPYSPLTSAVCLPLECYHCRWNCRYERPHCVKDISPGVIADAVNGIMNASADQPRIFVQGSQLWQPSEWQPAWAFQEDCLRARDVQIKLADRLSWRPHGGRSDVRRGTRRSGEKMAIEPVMAPVPVEDAGAVAHVREQADRTHAPGEGNGQFITCQEHEDKCDVSIVVCTKNRAELLDRMLGSLRIAAREVACEVIVVEGGSSDNTVEVLRKHRVSQVYSESECLGQGRHSWPQLYNFGFSKARGRWAMYASDDITFSEGAIDRAVGFLDCQKEEVSGGIFFYRNSEVTDPQWADHGIDITHGCKLLMNYGLVRLDHFREVGGLDESYQFYCADTDFCYKLYERSWQLIPLPGCFVDHDNVLDIQKSRNMAGADRDIELLLRRWQHFVSPDLPQPRRLLWSDEIKDAFGVPAELDELDSSIDNYWQGLACLQQGLFHEARDHFVHATDGSCNHWRVWLYLARAVSRCQEQENRTEPNVLTR